LRQNFIGAIEARGRQKQECFGLVFCKNKMLVLFGINILEIILNLLKLGRAYNA
jgi:hypothetical protein